MKEAMPLRTASVNLTHMMLRESQTQKMTCYVSPFTEVHQQGNVTCGLRSRNTSYPWGPRGVSGVLIVVFFLDLGVSYMDYVPYEYVKNL